MRACTARHCPNTYSERSELDRTRGTCLRGITEYEEILTQVVML